MKVLAAVLVLSLGAGHATAAEPARPDVRVLAEIGFGLGTVALATTVGWLGAQASSGGCVIACRSDTLVANAVLGGALVGIALAPAVISAVGSALGARSPWFGRLVSAYLGGVLGASGSLLLYLASGVQRNLEAPLRTEQQIMVGTAAVLPVLFALLSVQLADQVAVVEVKPLVVPTPVGLVAGVAGSF